MIFEDLPTVPTSEELVDQAFSRAARAGRAKSGLEAQQSMLLTASNVISDNLDNVVTAWPDFDTVDPFYRELADAIVGADDGVERRSTGSRTQSDDTGEVADGVDGLRQSLSEVTWASRQAIALRDEYQPKLRGDADTARKHR